MRLQLSKFGAILIYRTGGPEKFCQKAALRIFKQFTRKKNLVRSLLFREIPALLKPANFKKKENKTSRKPINSCI